LFFWYYQIISDNLHIKAYEIENFTIPVDRLCSSVTKTLESLYDDYLSDIEKNSQVRQTTRYANIDSFKQYEIGKSKHLIDRIDDFIGPLYGLTDKEIEYIKNYELNVRLTDKDE